MLSNPTYSHIAPCLVGIFSKKPMLNNLGVYFQPSVVNIYIIKNNLKIYRKNEKKTNYEFIKLYQNFDMCKSPILIQFQNIFS